MTVDMYIEWPQLRSGLVSNKSKCSQTDIVVVRNLSGHEKYVIH